MREKKATEFTKRKEKKILKMIDMSHMTLLIDPEGVGWQWYLPPGHGVYSVGRESLGGTI